jgi:vacuolar-type H+-ATPase subunit I/STV1
MYATIKNQTEAVKQLLMVFNIVYGFTLFLLLGTLINCIRIYRVNRSKRNFLEIISIIAALTVAIFRGIVLHTVDSPETRILDLCVSVLVWTLLIYQTWVFGEYLIIFLPLIRWLSQRSARIGQILLMIVTTICNSAALLKVFPAMENSTV